jgi:hypothetical protein
MATRGREANRLYVDTSYDPHVDIAHQVVEPVPAEVVLRKVLATSGAEVSATQTRAAEAIAAAKAAGRWRPLLDQMRRAEQRGLPLQDTLKLVHGAETANRLVGLTVGLARWITAEEANGPKDPGPHIQRTHRDVPRPEM